MVVGYHSQWNTKQRTECKLHQAERWGMRGKVSGKLPLMVVAWGREVVVNFDMMVGTESTRWGPFHHCQPLQVIVQNHAKKEKIVLEAGNLLYETTTGNCSPKGTSLRRHSVHMENGILFRRLLGKVMFGI